jgi:hypothetical protein
MTATTAPLPAPFPLSARIFAIAGLLWSLFGAFQFALQTFIPGAGLHATGMTTEQAALYAGLPVWMAVVFAIGTLGGTLGCALLIARRKTSVTVLAVSLVAYVMLWTGDALLGVFAAFGTPQVLVLSSVVLIAAGLLWLARWLDQRGVLA